MLIHAAKEKPYSVRAGTNTAGTSMKEFSKRRAVPSFPSLPGAGVTPAPDTPTSARRNGEGEELEKGQVLLQVASMQLGSSEAAASLVNWQYCSALLAPHTESAVTGRYVATLATPGYSPVSWARTELKSSCKHNAHNSVVLYMVEVWSSQHPKK